jgi:hypothetical protein
MAVRQTLPSVGLGLAAIAIGLSIVGCSGDEGQPGPTGASSGSATIEDAGSDATNGKKKAAEVGCTTDSECETEVCFKGNAQSFCTIRCTVQTAAAVCGTPYTGSCNKQGYCKRD